MLDDPELPFTQQNTLELNGRLAFTTMYDGASPQDIRHGEFLAEALGEKSMLILRNHGAIVTGTTIAQAYTDLYLLDRFAEALILALSTGQRLHAVPEEVARQYSDVFEDHEYKRDHFRAMKRLLDQREPDYAS
jgi:ribulose-5-phosphate 4-epimerase/fuculose-1-phosphate aldolase